MTGPPSETLSYFLYGIEALPVAVAVRPADFGDVPQRVLQAIVGSGFRTPGPARVTVQETGPGSPARSLRIKVAQCSLARA